MQTAPLFCNCGAKYALQNNFIAVELVGALPAMISTRKSFPHAHNLSVRDAARAIIFYSALENSTRNNFIILQISRLLCCFCFEIRSFHMRSR